MASWRKGTKHQYQTYLSKWITFCSEREVNFLSAPVFTGIDFLASLFDNGYAYSSINTARSALSSLLQTEPPFGQHMLVKRFMKGVFEIKPSLPRYTEIWDVSPVLNFIRGRTTLSLKELSYQLTFLLLILSGQRCQTVHLLAINNMTMSENKCTFHISQNVKQSRPGNHIPPVVYESYPVDTKLCVVSHIRDYLKRTEPLRSPHCQQLLISFLRPYKPVTKDTISRWCKQFLNTAGVDVGKFKTHSTRAASTSHLAAHNIEISSILQAVGWSNERTFQAFYHKQLERSDETFNFGTALLQSTVTSFD